MSRWIVVTAMVACSGASGPGTGVEPPELTDGFGADLSASGGCADVSIYAANANATVALFLFSAELIENEPVTHTFALPDPALDLRVETGTSLTLEICNDIAYDPGPQVDTTWEPVAGSVEITITPREYYGADAEVTFTDVVFEDGRESVDLGPLVVGPVHVGWLPG